MPRTPKEDCEPDETQDGSTADDQEHRKYYYDDAHGYEVYDPNEDRDEESDVEDEPAP